MAAKNVILALLALTSLAYGQTRALFVTTNGTVQWGTTLRFDGPLDFTTNGFAATTRSNLSLGLPALTNSSNAGLLSALGGMTTNGDASGLTNFPALLLTTNSAESAFPAALLRTNSSLSAFPAGLLRTNGDGSGLTNLPNANLSNAIGVLPLSNGGTGSTNASNARTALGLGSAATNNSTAFQPANTNLTALAGGDGSSLTNVTITDASTLTNFPAELMRTNGNASTLTNFPVELLRTNGDASGLIGVATYPTFSNNAGKVLVVATNETGVEWLPVSNTVTDASLLTNFPASLLTTNGSAAGLTNFPTELLRTNGSAAGLTGFPASLLTTNGDASGLTNFPTFNQNTTGTASNVTGVVAVANGGTGASDVTNARINLLPSYTGNSNRVLALNTNATDLVWAVDGGGTANLTNVTNTLGLANGGTGATNSTNALYNLQILTNGTGIAIGKGSSNGGQAVLIGADTLASGNVAGVGIGYGAAIYDDYAVAIGYYSAAGKAGTIAIGGDAKTANSAFVTNSVQIGSGSNSTANSLQVFGWGNVSSSEWGYLANASTQGGYAMTNTAGISGSKTFVAYDGTNYTTNTVTFSNGIITGWTP